MRLLINKRYFLIEIIFIVLLLQQALLSNSTGILHTLINYIDEIIALILLVRMMLKYKQVIRKLTRIEKKVLIAYALFLLLGLISSIARPIQPPFLVLSDMLVCMKTGIFYFYTRTLLNLEFNSELLIEKISRIIKPLILLTFILAIHDIFFTPFFIQADYRYFMNALQLYFGHPSVLAAFSITCAAILMANLALKPKKSAKIKVFVWISLLLAAFTLRGKAIAAVIAIVVIYISLFVFKRYAIYFGLLGGTLAAIVAGWSQFSFYFGAVAQRRDDFIRAKLLRDSITLANRFFPLGTGYGTFGSNIAAENYSPFYTALGYSGISGGSKEENFALSDSFWPIVIAQFGWIGLLLFIYCLVGIVRKVMELYKINRYLFWAGISIVIYEVIASTAESAFFHPVAIPLFCVLGIVINCGEIENGKRF